MTEKLKQEKSQQPKAVTREQRHDVGMNTLTPETQPVNDDAKDVAKEGQVVGQSRHWFRSVKKLRYLYQYK